MEKPKVEKKIEEPEVQKIEEKKEEPVVVTKPKQVHEIKKDKKEFAKAITANINTNNKINSQDNEDYVTDDQFFDDFFADDDN